MLTHASRAASTQHFVAKATALPMTSFAFLLFLFTSVMCCGADGPVGAPASEKASGEDSAVPRGSPPTPPTPPAAGVPAPAEAPANADSGTTALQAEETQGDKATLELLRQLAKRKSVVRQKLALMPQKVSEQTAAIMRSLDDFWKSDSASQVHDRFMEKATRIAGDVVLDERYSSLDAFWAEYKSLVDDDLLNDMARVYIDQLFDAIKPTADGLADDYKQPMDDALNKAFAKAQQALAAEFDESLRAQFPNWPQCFTTLPLPSLNTPRPDAPGTSPLGRRPFAKVGLALVLAPIIARIVRSMVGKVVKRASAKVATKVTTKVAGKVAGKLIPFIGWALLALDVADAATARSRFEDAIRKEVLSELSDETKPEAIWQSSADGNQSAREEAERSIKEQLTAYTDQMQSVTNQFLEIASLVDSPAFKKLAVAVESRTKDGKPDPVDIGHLVDRCKALSDAFGPLCTTVDDFDTLDEMVLTAPDKRSLRALADLLGPRIIPLYEKHRGALLEANAVLGARHLADMIAKEQDWHFVAEEFRHLLGTSPTEAERHGLLLALTHRFDITKFSNPALLGNIAKHSDLFTRLVGAGTDSSLIVDVMMHDDAASFLERMQDGDADLTLQVVNRVPLTRLRRFGADGRANTVLSMWTIARQAGIAPTVFATSLGDSEDLFAAHRDHGNDGVRIWLAYTGDAPGTTQRQRAAQALSLHADGCPISICLDGDNLTLASWFYSFPVVGPTLHSWLYPIISRAPWLGWLVLVGAVAAIVAFFWRLILWILGTGGRQRVSYRGNTRHRPPRATVVDHHSPSPTGSLPPPGRLIEGEEKKADNTP
jgi:hypothetical protein